MKIHFNNARPVNVGAMNAGKIKHKTYDYTPASTLAMLSYFFIYNLINWIGAGIWSVS